jgi:anti-anti-sigma regulatory factor
MEIGVEQVQSKPAVTILNLKGDLDGSNYQVLINKAKEVHQAGTTHMVLDFGQVGYMSSAGLVALHTIAKLLQGAPLPDPEAGWEAFHAIGRDQDAGLHAQLKLLNPQSRVDQTLELTGMKEFFEIFTDRQAAIASFG